MNSKGARSLATLEAPFSASAFADMVQSRARPRVAGYSVATAGAATQLRGQVA